MFCSASARESVREREAIERAFINASFVRHARWKLMKVFMRGFDVISVTSGNKMENSIYLLIFIVLVLPGVPFCFNPGPDRESKALFFPPSQLNSLVFSSHEQINHH